MEKVAIVILNWNGAEMLKRFCLMCLNIRVRMQLFMLQTMHLLMIRLKYLNNAFLKFAWCFLKKLGLCRGI